MENPSESDETVSLCPNGCQPQSSAHDPATGKTTTVMAPSDCSSCEFRGQCPVEQSGGRFLLRHTPAQRRLADRRAEQATDAFRENYAIRAGEESLNSGLKRRTGMGRLRTRGLRRVRMAVLLRCAGWNVLRALAALKKRRKRAAAATAGVFCRVFRHGTGGQAAGELLAAFVGRSARRPLVAPALTAA